MKSISLFELQRTLQSLLMQPPSSPPVPAQQKSNSEIALADIIVETTAVPRATRFGIYANAYRARFVEALAADYSALKNYLGDDEFERLVHAYIAAHPSHYFSMRYVGQYLGEFLRNTAPYSEHRDLYELALFEWALCDAFDAADNAPLTHDDFRRIDPAAWPALRLQFHPSLQRVMLFGNTPALWSALQAEQQPPAFESAAQARPWLIWRQQLRLLFRPLAELEPLVFDAFCNGADFAEVCEQVCEVLPAEQVPPLVAGLIQQWLQDGLIIHAGHSPTP